MIDHPARSVGVGEANMQVFLRTELFIWAAVQQRNNEINLLFFTQNLCDFFGALQGAQKC